MVLLTNQFLKGDKMEKLITTFTFLLMFTVGCTDQTSVTSPDNNTSGNENVTLEKKIRGGGTGFLVHTVSKQINGDLGGFIYLGNEASAFNGQGVYAAIYFPAGSFSGTETITMTIDPDNLSGTFGPGMEFNTPVYFSALLTGIKLRGPGSSDYEFVYEGPNRQQTVIPNSFLYIDKQKGVLGILNAEIPHFSRYGWIR